MAPGPVPAVGSYSTLITLPTLYPVGTDATPVVNTLVTLLVIPFLAVNVIAWTLTLRAAGALLQFTAITARLRCLALHVYILRLPHLAALQVTPLPLR